MTLRVTRLNEAGISDLAGSRETDDPAGPCPLPEIVCCSHINENYYQDHNNVLGDKRLKLKPEARLGNKHHR